jgi:hypothetical protein
LPFAERKSTGRSYDVAADRAPDSGVEEEAMPRLTAALQTSKYVDQPHLVVLLDEVPLDVFLARDAGDPSLEGLVSTLAGCLHDASEREVVDRTILPVDGRSSTAPLLVCPDDCDLGCTVVVAEVERHGDTVTWTRVGVLRSDRAASVPASGEVAWFERVGPLGFGLDEYQAFVARCRQLATPWWRS